VRSISVPLRGRPEMEAPALLPPTSTYGWGNQNDIAYPLEAKNAARDPQRRLLTEDEIARIKLGPRGVPGGQDTAKMTPQQEKNIPKTGVFDGHTA
jgi:hypothetical protein